MPPDGGSSSCRSVPEAYPTSQSRMGRGFEANLTNLRAISARAENVRRAADCKVIAALQLRKHSMDGTWRKATRRWKIEAHSATQRSPLFRCAAAFTRETQRLHARKLRARTALRSERTLRESSMRISGEIAGQSAATVPKSATSVKEECGSGESHATCRR